MPDSTFYSIRAPPAARQRAQVDVRLDYITGRRLQESALAVPGRTFCSLASLNRRPFHLDDDMKSSCTIYGIVRRSIPLRHQHRPLCIFLGGAPSERVLVCFGVWASCSANVGLLCPRSLCYFACGFMRHLLLRYHVSCCIKSMPRPKYTN